MKICNKCNHNLDYNCFSKDKKLKDGVRSICKSCQSKDKQLYLKTNRDKHLAYNRSYMTTNPAKRKRSRMLYKGHVKQATPKWANLEQMNETYQLAKQLTESTGIQHDVDHIVPLRGRTVCGLHCQANLQPLPHEDNMKKRNNVWPDMWS
jgi:hypothetical protein